MSTVNHNSGILPTAPKARVLVVEDDAAQRKLFTAHLDRDGYDVIEAHDGAHALSIVAEARPDIILMDRYMPVMDGLACTAELKRRSSTAHIPIIMASAAKDNVDVVAGLEAGADEYIAKPLEPKIFRLRVRSMVRLAQANQALRQSSQILARQNHDLSIILDLSFNLNAGADLHTVLQHVVAATRELTHCKSIALYLPTADHQHLELTEFCCDDQQPPSHFEMPVGAGISGTAFGTVHPLVFDNPQRLGAMIRPAEAALFPCLPAFAGPLFTGEESVGVLSVAGRDDETAFEPKELAYLDMIANLAASSIRDIQTRQARDDAHESIVVALAKLAEHRDDDTGRHLDRVTQYCLTLSEELRQHAGYEAIDDAFVAGMKLAVPLHDIGKVAVPDKILLKPGRLTDEEMEIMRTHVSFGADTIRSVRARSPQSHFLDLAEEVCSCHHEWFDGQGYPNKLVGEQIPLSARIAALADVYDALTTKRVYKDAMPHSKAFNIIVENSGSQFDPAIVQAFIDQEAEFIRLAKELADDPVEDAAPKKARTP